MAQVVRPIKSTFGTSSEAFSFQYVRSIIEDKDKPIPSKEEEICRYYSDYFVKISNIKSIIMWNPSKKNYEVISDEIFRRTYCPSDFKLVWYDQNGNKQEWKISCWFYTSKNEPYRSCMKVGYPRVFRDKTGEKYVNLMPKMLHEGKKRKKLSSYPAKTQAGVKKIWDHIHIVWTSRNDKQFSYLKKWFAHLVSGKKMTSCLYLRAVEGIGKSLIIEFLKWNVLGESLVFQTSESEILSGTFNGALFGIMLFVLEEAPCATLADWKKLDSKLKNFITEQQISIRLMHQDHFKVDNTVSFIINTNSYAIALNHGSRRYMATDCSSEFKGNRQYFEELNQIMKDPEVGEAFYFDCLNIAQKTPDFHEQFDIPLTAEFIQNVNDNSPSIISYIKDTYILKKKGIDMKYKLFYDDYVEYCKDKKLTHVIKRGQVSQKLMELGINYMPGCTKHSNLCWITNTPEELHKIFKDKNLIAQYDDVEASLDDDVDPRTINGRTMNNNVIEASGDDIDVDDISISMDCEDNTNKPKIDYDQDGDTSGDGIDIDVDDFSIDDNRG